MGRWLKGGTIALTPITCATPANLMLCSESSHGGRPKGGKGLPGNDGATVKQCKHRQCTAEQMQRLEPLTTLTYELTLATA